MTTDPAHTITKLAELQALYGTPNEASLVKETDRITPEYGKLIEASPFLVLATHGPNGLDCSPRGDRPGFVRIVDDRTLLVPDRQGNQRIDSLRNIIHDPAVALLFLIPGIGETLRVNGRARISADPELTRSFAVGDRAPATVLIVTVTAVFFQCSRAVVRADLWNPDRRVAPDTLPRPGQILAALSQDRVGGPAYDQALPGRVQKTLY